MSSSTSSSSSSSSSSAAKAAEKKKAKKAAKTKAVEDVAEVKASSDEKVDLLLEMKSPRDEEAEKAAESKKHHHHHHHDDDHDHDDKKPAEAAAEEPKPKKKGGKNKASKQTEKAPETESKDPDSDVKAKGPTSPRGPLQRSLTAAELATQMIKDRKKGEVEKTDEEKEVESVRNRILEAMTEPEIVEKPAVKRPMKRRFICCGPFIEEPAGMDEAAEKLPVEDE